ncbi:MAG: extracellular solute-binding protein [Actinobacteria bacterium]|nr:extracellular solute-binding protein [Actinomycetota bacterium]MCL5885685.1 extracellular solute-binding protein [Actinomycetota bacterium]
MNIFSKRNSVAGDESLSHGGSLEIPGLPPGNPTGNFRRERNRGWRSTRLPVVLASGALLLAACSSSPASSNTSAKIQDIALWESHNGPPVGTEVSALVSKFNATHKNVHVTVVVTKASSKLQDALAAGDPPVLAEISHYDGVYVKAGALVSWNSFFKGSSIVNKNNFVPSIWKNGDVGGQHYRFQADAKFSIVDYNKTLFAKAGITSPPTTWSELAADAAKLKALGGGLIPIGWKDSSSHILPAFASNGGSWLKNSMSVGHSVDFNTPAGVATFSYFRNLYANGELIIDHGTTLREDLASGHLAMIDGTSAGYQKTLTAVAGKFPVGSFVEPGGTTGHAYNMTQGLGFVLPKGHTHAQDEAAWTFVQWWFEPAQQVAWAEATGYPPETRAGIAAMPASFLASHPGEAATIQAAESPYSYPRPTSNSYKEVQAVLDSTFYDIVTGKESVSSGLAKLDSSGNSYMSGASEL